MAPILHFVATYPAYGFACVLLFAVGFAWWKGGGPERTVGLLFLAAFLASLATDSPAMVQYFKVELIATAIDIVLLSALTLVARAANRRWTVVAAGLQLLILAAHAARAINIRQAAFVYMVMTAIWPILQILLLVTGTILHSRRVLRMGTDPSWKPFLH